MGWQFLTRKKPQIIIFAISIICLVTTTVLFVILPRYVNTRLASTLAIKNESVYFSSWSESFPSYFNLYFFNITNPEHVKVGHHPILEEIGPYEYKIKQKKIIQEWDHSKGNVRYQEVTYFTFNSNNLRKENDLITTINLNYLEKNENNDILITKSVRELTFQNFENVALQKDSFQNLETYLGTVHIKNGSQEMFSIYTGDKGINKFTNIISYKGKNKLDHWPFVYCNKIQGTDGKQFPFPVTTKSRIFIFVPSLCQSIRLKFIKWVRIGQMHALRFIMPEKNLGICSGEEGVHSLGACGSPAVVSSPHFLGSKKYIKNVKGLQSPTFQRYGSFLDIEPSTGLTLRSCIRIMTSFNVPFNNKSEVLVPSFWMEQNFTMPSYSMEALQETVLRPLEVINDIPKFFGGFGCVLLIIAVVVGIRKSDSTHFVAKEGSQTNTVNNNYNFAFPVNPELY